jgi:hypothetical protein
VPYGREEFNAALPLNPISKFAEQNQHEHKEHRSAMTLYFPKNPTQANPKRRRRLPFLVGPGNPCSRLSGGVFRAKRT